MPDILDTLIWFPAAKFALDATVSVTWLLLWLKLRALIVVWLALLVTVQPGAAAL